MKEGRLPKRQYTEEFKAEAVRLAASVGGHEAARRLGVPVATLGNWSRRRRALSDGRATPTPVDCRRQGRDLLGYLQQAVTAWIDQTEPPSLVPTG